MLALTVEVKCNVYATLEMGARLKMVDPNDQNGAWWPLVCSLEIKIEETKCNKITPAQLLKFLQSYWSPRGYDITEIISVDAKGVPRSPSDWEKQMNLFKEKSGPVK